ncbi:MULTISPECIES: DNA-binding protein [Neisseria]|uniref:DNA-binding protein n=1 Tax=Neisseria TaxID=482 RepID=UPI0027E4AED7|nr:MULTISPECIES: DNA-binding protein [Neisseria]
MINHECINQPYGRILKFSRIQAKEMLTPDELKEKFKNDGITFSGWARENGYRPQEVIRVVNGFSKANYGKGYEIAKKLGLK